MAHLLLLNRWQYYRGKDGNQAARALNAHIMADLIGQWVQPYPSAVYPKGMKRTDPLCKPARGYYRRSFEEGPNGRPGPWQRYATESPEDIELEREKPWGSSEAEIGDDAAAESPSVTEPAETVTPLQARQTGRTSRASAQQRARRRSRKPTAAKPRRSARKPKPTRRRKRRAPRPLNRR